MATKRKNSRAKGQRGERQLVKAFETWWGTEFFRTPMSGGLSTMGFQFKGVEISGDISTPDPTFPFCVEGKNCEGWHLEQLLTAPKCDIYSWWTQTVDETPDHLIPLLIFKKNHHDFLFAMKKADFVLDIPVPSVTLETEDGPVLIAQATLLWNTSPDVWRKNDQRQS